ncbi:MAG: CYTH and CHAD domain-containing protein [Sporichthyaceae bacterium]
MREVEDKFRVHSRFQLPDLEAAPTLSRVSPPRTSTLVATYYDTEDLRLAREGITMRYRHGDGADGWTLKLPVAAARVGVREEITAAAGPDQLPDDLRSLVTAYVRSAELAPRATLRTQRTTYDAHGADDELLAEVVDDHVEAMQGDRSAARFREVEVEDRGGGSSVLDEIGDVLRAAGAVGGEFQPKVVRALGRRATSAPEPPEPNEVKPEDPARAAITALLRRHVRRLIALDVDVRFGADDAVHQMRVTSRRLRAGLREFADLLDPTWSERLQGELQWLAGELAGERDREVVAARLLDRLAALPEDLVVGPVASRLASALGADADAAQEAVDAALGSDRYVRLLDDLVDAAMHPRTNDRGNAAARDVLPRIMKQSWERLAKRAKIAIAAGDEPEGFHAARIAAKRTRYLAEALAPVFGKPASRLAEEVEKVQEVLGEHQDAVVAGELLQRIAQAPRIGRTAFTFGVLHAQQQEEAAAARARFLALWPGVAQPKHRRWVKIA